MATKGTRSLTITVERRVEHDEARDYIVCGQQPDISTNPKIYLPVCYKTEPLHNGGTEEFRYSEEYFAFMGVLERGLDSIWSVRAIQKDDKPAKIGTNKNDGDTLSAGFPKGARKLILLNEREKDKSRQGTFTIECAGQSTELDDGNKHVVGFMQRFSNTLRVVAAVEYIDGVSYVINPAKHMNIRVANREELHQLPNENSNKPVEIKIPKDRTKVHLYEVRPNQFGPTPGDTQANDGFQFGSEAPKYQPQAQPRQQSTPLPQGARFGPSSQPKKKQPKKVDTLLVQAQEMGFKSKNQFIAYKGFTKFNSLHLAGFYEDSELQNMAKNVDLWISALGDVEDAVTSDTVNQLCLLSLYDCILLLDNSESMIIFDDGERVQQMKQICGTIVQIESILRNTRDVRAVFLGQKVPTMEIQDLEQVENKLEEVFDSGSGLIVQTTKLGTTLRDKILKNRVYDIATTTKPRPLLVSIVTDGKPEGERYNMLSEEMKKCKNELIRRQNLGDKHVVFQISRVGSSKSAKTFIEKLSQDEGLRDICHCTTYLDLEDPGDPDDDISEFIKVYLTDVVKFSFMATTDH
ncbi:hypothetical protein GGS24DRAFT_175295 [Hypoxylon argillaceum]|nr:hypothetical protein GGS24DRAFT_175295 [Hypoxylon argillaceum]